MQITVVKCLHRVLSFTLYLISKISTILRRVYKNREILTVERSILIIVSNNFFEKSMMLYIGTQKLLYQQNLLTLLDNNYKF